MNNILSLLKVSFINRLKLNSFKVASGKDKLKNAGIGLAIIMVAIIILGYCFLYFNMIAESLIEIDRLDLLLYLSYILSFIVVFMTTIYKSQGALFSIRDFELLSSLPFKKNQIFASKVIELYLTNIGCMLLFIIPASVVYFIHADGSSMFFINLFIMIIFIPLIPMILSSVLGVLLSYVSSKMRNKNIFIIVGSVVMVCIISILPNKMIGYIQKLVENNTAIADAIGKIFPQANWFVNGLKGTDYIGLILFVLCSIIIFILFLVIFNKVFIITNIRFRETYKKNNYKMGELKISNPVIALAKKELKRYLSSPIYVLNTAIMPLISTVATIGLLVGGTDILNKAMDINVDLNILPGMFLGLLTGISMMSPTTSSSISLEGKNLWILKSSPIRFRDIALSKALVNFMVFIPLNIINVFIISIAFKFTVLQVIALLIIPNLGVVVISFIGLIINLLLPKFNFISDTQVVKQSASVMVAMLVGVILIFIGISGYFVLNSNIELYEVIITVILSIIALCAWRFLNTKGEVIFRDI